MNPINVEPSGMLDFSQLQSNRTVLDVTMEDGLTSDYTLHLYYVGYQTFILKMVSWPLFRKERIFMIMNVLNYIIFYTPSYEIQLCYSRMYFIGCTRTVYDILDERQNGSNNFFYTHLNLIYMHSVH